MKIKSLPSNSIISKHIRQHFLSHLFSQCWCLNLRGDLGPQDFITLYFCRRYTVVFRREVEWKNGRTGRSLTPTWHGNALPVGNNPPRLQGALVSPQILSLLRVALTPLCRDSWFCSVGCAGSGAAATGWCSAASPCIRNGVGNNGRRSRAVGRKNFCAWHGNIGRGSSVSIEEFCIW